MKSLLLVLVAVVVLLSLAYESNLIQDSGLFITSTTVLALILWFVFMSMCVVGVSKIVS